MDTQFSNVYKYIHSRETQRQGSIQQQEPYSIYTQMIIRRVSSALPTIHGDSIVFLLLWTSSTTVIFIFFFSYYSFFKCVLMLIIGFWKRISHQYRERERKREVELLLLSSPSTTWFSIRKGDEGGVVGQSRVGSISSASILNTRLTCLLCSSNSCRSILFLSNRLSGKWRKKKGK